jgi:TP901 family phage tail tape measure protein
MASNKRLNATITIGGAITGSLKAALGSTRDGLLEIGKSIKTVENRQKLLGRSIEVFGKMGKNVDGMRAEYGRLVTQTDRLRNAQRSLLDVEKARALNAEKMEAVRSKIPFGDHIGALASIGGVIGALHAFEKINDAETELRVALMDKSGGVPAQFEEIRQQAIALHNTLPGTLADFHNVAVALKENGMSTEMIAGGALKAAAQLGVVLKMPVEQAAEMTAKLRESFQLSEGELGKMADLSQRARFAFGLNSEDLLLGAKYYGGSLGALHTGGADNVAKVYALQGIAAQNGIDGSTFGTNFGMMLTRLSTLPLTMQKHSPQMKAVLGILKEYGVQLQFFDKKGNFAGIDNMVQQLGKLQSIASDEKRMEVLKTLFGQEAMRVAGLIATKGVDGYQKALKAEQDQASLQQRIGVEMGSFRNKITSLTGSLETLVGMGIEPLGKALIPLIDTANKFVTRTLMPWVETHPKLTGGIEMTVGALAALKIGTLAVQFAWLALRGQALAIVGLFYRTGAAATVAGTEMEAAAGGATLLGRAFLFVGSGLLWVGRALLLNPIGLAVTAIAGGAFLIYENWDKLKSWFGGLWESIKKDFSAFEDWLMGKVRWVGDKWKEVKAFFHAGEDPAPAQPAAAGSPAPRRVWTGKGYIPTVPAMATRAPGGSVYHDHSTTTITVVQQPGQDGTALAREISRQMQKRQGVQQRSAIYDQPVGG